MNRLAMVFVLLFAGTARGQTPAELQKYLSAKAQTPEEYVVSKFAK
jgi:hypothetical protein